MNGKESRSPKSSLAGSPLERPSRALGAVDTDDDPTGSRVIGHSQILFCDEVGVLRMPLQIAADEGTGRHQGEPSLANVGERRRNEA
jgi:hypothetical protein